MNIVFRILTYLFSIVGFICILSALILYFAISKNLVDTTKLEVIGKKYLKVNLESLCPTAQPSPPPKKESANQPYSLWVIENMDAEKAAGALLSLNSEEIVKYLTTIEREKSLKILEEIYTSLEKEGEEGKKRKQEIDKKLLGAIR
ncbi:MAG: hypothetical protein ACK4NF_06755 [Planctomycetota bacterium]